MTRLSTASEQAASSACPVTSALSLDLQTRLRAVSSTQPPAVAMVDVAAGSAGRHLQLASAARHLCRTRSCGGCGVARQQKEVQGDLPESEALPQLRAPNIARRAVATCTPARAVPPAL